jgi:hypothetical protein
MISRDVGECRSCGVGDTVVAHLQEEVLGDRADNPGSVAFLCSTSSGCSALLPGRQLKYRAGAPLLREQNSPPWLAADP